MGVEEELLVVDRQGRPLPLGPEALEVAVRRGQGETVEETKESLREAIRLIFEDRLEDMRRGLPANAIQTVVAL